MSNQQNPHDDMFDSLVEAVEEMIRQGKILQDESKVDPPAEAPKRRTIRTRE